MRRMSSVLTLASMCLVSTLAVSQCAESWYTANINCQSRYCSGSVTQTLPQGNDEYGVLYVCGTIYCCNQGYPNCNSEGLSCNGSGSLANPAMRQHLLELAKSADVVVSTCKGEYLPLSLALATQPISGHRREPSLRQKHSVKELMGEGGS